MAPNYLHEHNTSTPEELFKSLLMTDVGDSYPLISLLAAVTLACPLGKAGKFLYAL